MKRLIPFLLIPILLFSCDEDRISFTQAQPVEVAPDARLRDDFRGTYFSEEDSTWLVVTDKRVEEKTLPINLNFGGVHVDVKDDKDAHIRTDFGKDSSFSVRLNMEGNKLSDSLKIKGDVLEKLFDLNRGDEARYFRGYYFLNVLFEEGDGYKVRILRKTPEGLLLCRIESDSVLKLLQDEDFIEKKSEDNDYHWSLSPSRKELKRLIDRGLFSNVRLYRRVEEN